MFQFLLSVSKAAFAGRVHSLFFAFAVVAVAVFLSPAAARAQENMAECPPLVLAVESGEHEDDIKAEVQRLLESGADVDAKCGDNGETALHNAAHSGLADIIRLLLDHGADVDVRDNYGLTPLMLAADSAYLSEDAPVLEAVNILLDYGADPNAQDNSAPPPGLTPLHFASAINGIILCEYSSNGARMCEPVVLSASDIAAAREIVLALVRRGANLNARDGDGKTPLDYARQFGPPEYAAFFASLMNAPLSGESGVIAQIDKEIEDLQMQMDSLRSSIAAACLETQPCQGTQEQRESLRMLEDQIERRMNQVAALEITAASSQRENGEGGNSKFAIGLGVAVLAGAILHSLSPSGDADAFSIQPLASYAYNDGSESSRYGMRLTYHRDSWRLWWLADDARLGWGGEWRGNYLRADASAWETANALDMSAGLGMEWTTQGWRLRPSFRLRTDSGGWKSGADLSAEWARDGWTFRPSVRAADLSSFADARLRLHLAREF